MLTTVTNAPYPNRIQLLLGDYIGPLIKPTSPPLEFDPTVDLEVYVDGIPLVIQNASYDAVNNRYLLFADRPFNLQGVIQIIHHVPNPPFQYGLGVFTAQRFRYTSSYYNMGVVPPTAIIQDSGAASPVYSIRTPFPGYPWVGNYTLNYLSPNGRYLGQIFYDWQGAIAGNPSPVVFYLWDVNTLSPVGADPLLTGATLATMTQVTNYTGSLDAIADPDHPSQAWIPVSEPLVDNNGTIWYVTQVGTTISLYSLAVGAGSPTLVNSFVSAGSPWDHIYSGCVIDPTNQVVATPTSVVPVGLNYEYTSASLLPFGSSTPLQNLTDTDLYHDDFISADYVQPTSYGGNNVVYLENNAGTGLIVVESGGAITKTRLFPYPSPVMGEVDGNNSCPFLIGDKWYIAADGLLGGTDAGAIELDDDGTTLTVAASPQYVDRLPTTNIMSIPGVVYMEWIAPLS